MSIRNFALVATVAVLAAGCGQSPAPSDAAPTDAVAADAAPPAALPATVTAALAELAGMCSDAEGTPHTEQAVKRTDLNGDGREDFVLYAGWINCENAASIYGDRQKALTVFAGDGAGAAAEAFSDWVFDAKIEGTGATAKLWLTSSGEQCGRPPAPDFASESFCDRAIDWNAGTGHFDHAPAATVRMIE